MRKEMQQLVSDGTFRKVRNNIDRLFDKNLTDLIRGIRNNKENEARYITTCIEEIKLELRQDSTFIKANAIEKLSYLQMLGYDISWAAFNIIEVMASTRFCEKRTGYLAATQAFTDETDVLMLTTNLIRKDLLSSSNIYDIGVALNGLACFATDDLARDLLNDIVNLLSSSRPYVRKKAVLLLYKIFLKYPESLRTIFPKLKERLEDQDPGVQSAAVNVVCELARKNPRNYLGIQNVFFKLLNTSSNNWMLIKIIKLFGSLVPHEPKLGRRLLEPLTNLINSTSAMSLLYECINTVIAILISISSEGPGDYTPSIQLCVQKLGVLIEDSDQNLKYLGLLAMGKILQTHPKAVQAHKDIVLRCLGDKDESIRLRALDLLYGMVSKKNIIEIVRKLMEHLDASEGSFYRDELLRRIISICAHDNYKFITNFEWYISVLVELTKVEGSKHGVLIADQLHDVSVRVQSVRHFSVSQMDLLVQNAQLLLQGNNAQRCNVMEVLLAAAWICGEFAQHVSDIPSLLDSMLRLKQSVASGPLLSVYIQNIAKLYAFQLCRLEADDDWDGIESLNNLLSSKLPEFQYTDHLEAQERASNLMALLKFATEKHAERIKVGPMLAIHFDGELNPVAAKAQRKVPAPEGLNLDEWINPEIERIGEAEESGSEEVEDLEEFEEEEVKRVLSPTGPKNVTQYGGGNLPHHGRKKSTNGGRAKRTQSPMTSYHQQIGGIEDSTLEEVWHKHHKSGKGTLEDGKSQRDREQQNNPYYVKDNTRQRPNRVEKSASNGKIAFAAGGPQPTESLQSPLEIPGVFGLESYLEQKGSTISWRSVGKKNKKGNKKKKDDGETTADNKKKERKVDSEFEEEQREEEKREEENECSVYRGDGEMPEGAISSSSSQEQINKQFSELDMGCLKDDGTEEKAVRNGQEKIMERKGKKMKKIAERSDGEQLKEKPKLRKEKKTKTTNKKRKSSAEDREETNEQSNIPTKKKTTKKLSKKASLRKEYASIDSPNGMVDGETPVETEGQLISLDDVDDIAGPSR